MLIKNLKNNKILKAFIFVAVFVFFFNFTSHVLNVDAGSSQNTTGFAWSGNIGWVSLNSSSEVTATDYGMNLKVGEVSPGSYAWSSNIGWIDLNPSDGGFGFPENPQHGVWLESDGRLTGWARAVAGDPIGTETAAFAGDWGGDKLWIIQEGGIIQKCDSTGSCTFFESLVGSPDSAKIFNNRIWVGLKTGHFESIGTLGGLTSYGYLGSSASSLLEYNGKLWVGQSDGSLLGCDRLGNCVNYGDKGVAIKAMKVFKNYLWLGQSDGILQLCYNDGSCLNLGDRGASINAIEIFDNKLWIGQEDGRLRSYTEFEEEITNANDTLQGSPITSLEVFDNKLWLGQDSGELRSCNSSGVCTNHGIKGSRINNVSEFNNKLWLGHSDGTLQSCNSLGSCTNHGDKGNSIDVVVEVSPFVGELWTAQGNGTLRKCNFLGGCEEYLVGGSSMKDIKIFDNKIWAAVPVGGKLYSCDMFGHCVSYINTVNAVGRIELFNNKVWVGGADGTLRSCDSSGICVNHGSKGGNILGMKVFANKLWLGSFGGVLLSCDSSGNCVNHGSKGVSTIENMAVFNNKLWIGMGDGVLQSCDSLGSCVNAGDKGDSVKSMEVFDNKLWLGMLYDGLLSCNLSGNCTNLGTKETNRGMYSMAVLDDELWIGLDSGEFISCDTFGNCLNRGEKSSDIYSMVGKSGSLNGWDGWIKFSGETTEAVPKPYGVYFDDDTKDIFGYAWGGDVIGWLKFGENPSDSKNPKCATCSTAVNTLKICKNSCDSGILFEGNQTATIGTPINVRACFNLDSGCGSATGDITTTSAIWGSQVNPNDVFDSATVSPNEVITVNAVGTEKLTVSNGGTPKEANITVPTQCNDGIDNDGDGYTDFKVDADPVVVPPDPPVKPACPFVAGSKDVLFNFTKGLRSDTIPYYEQVVKAIPSGNYNVKLMSYDGYSTRVSVTQPNEKFYVSLRNDSGQVKTTASTPDLADNVVSDIWIGTVNTNFSVPDGITNIRSIHTAYLDTSSANSVIPICALFKAIDPGCSSSTDDSELSNLQCDNGIDDDEDGLYDMQDSDCDSPTDDKESPNVKALPDVVYINEGETIDINVLANDIYNHTTGVTITATPAHYGTTSVINDGGIQKIRYTNTAYNEFGDFSFYILEDNVSSDYSLGGEIYMLGLYQCGDGIKQGTEECDLGVNNGATCVPPGGCASDCTATTCAPPPSVCGNNICEAGENFLNCFTDCFTLFGEF
ncbi:hypothetical protein A2442_01000 [Candidatus Campbellbacteria bacterium RIFOXYC2_FULL_35_25]|uniref:Uncharacterized protein n=1 Tax=Candidatus Campbellbacteria bacterium RIFOXYC2_FULL_35_25 TaxID=1797582 RepID=A0A1F5EIT0_9BACT|nr:MAG: hypothetical protein A2442_01000 [Candidatus Campbellbacteria bacterium RIFOXYC2_FULL_35_25]